MKKIKLLDKRCDEVNRLTKLLDMVRNAMIDDDQDMEVVKALEKVILKFLRGKLDQVLTDTTTTLIPYSKTEKYKLYQLVHLILVLCVN